VIPHAHPPQPEAGAGGCRDRLLEGPLDDRARPGGGRTYAIDPHSGTYPLDAAAFDGNRVVPDLIKIDVDSAELEALTGARRILERRHPHLIVQTHGPGLEAGCAELLVAAGAEGVPPLRSA
jgi:methyltransferase FkbM-like protein